MLMLFILFMFMEKRKEYHLYYHTIDFVQHTLPKTIKENIFYVHLIAENNRNIILIVLEKKLISYQNNNNNIKSQQENNHYIEKEEINFKKENNLKI